MFILTKSKGHKEQSAFNDLAELVEEADRDSELQETEDGEILPKYKELSQMNADFAAWVKVPGTDIDYPVMCTPADTDYYLRRAFDGSDATSGTPFFGVGCNADSICTIIHGHNMKNSSMFGTLDYFEDEEFYANNSIINLDSLVEEREYKVFAVVKCNVVADGENGFKYYDYGGDLSDERYSELVGWLTENSLYDTGTGPQSNEQLVILSTCSYHNSDGRFVVAAYRIK